FEPDVFRIFLLAEYRHRQLAGGPEHLDLAAIDLDRPGRQLRVLGAGRTPAHLAVDPHHPFRAQLLGRPEPGPVGDPHPLGEAVMVAQVDEQHAAVVADALAPAGEPRLLADVASAQLAAGMGAIAVHESSLDAARKGTCTASLVKNCNAIMARRSTGPAREAF